MTAAAARGDRAALLKLLQDEANEAPSWGVSSSARGAASVTLTGGGLAEPLVIHATDDASLTPYSATFVLPTSLAPGKYAVAFANDFAPAIYTPFDSFLNETVCCCLGIAFDVFLERESVVLPYAWGRVCCCPVRII
jgi:hypothetical protein